MREGVVMKTVGPGSAHNVSPLMNQETPNAHSAKDSSQKTGLSGASPVSFERR